MKTRYIYLSLLLLSFISCSEEDKILPEKVVMPELSSGTADFSNYVALGASFTAGYTDGAVFTAAQQNSFPNILAHEFAKAGGGSFTQPLMNDNTGGMTIPIPDVDDLPYRLVFNGSGPQRLNEFLAGLGAPAPPITTDASVNLGSSFNNVGVPGAKSFHVTIPGYGSLNPYFGRMASSASATMLGDALSQNPTFFTLSELGGNDVLAFATSGGAGVDQTGNIDPATYGDDDITDPNVFANVFSSVVSDLTSIGAKGVVANVPNIADLPYFTTVPHNPIPLDAATAGFLNSVAAYGAYNGGIQQAFAYLVNVAGVMSQEVADLEIAKRTITFAEGDGNAVVIIDESLTDLTAINSQLLNMRQATVEDLLVLPASSFIGTLANPNDPTTVNGVGVPLADKWVLVPSEQEEIKTATEAYNEAIANVVSSNQNIALVDLNQILTEVATIGADFDGFNLTSDLVTGGAVSLDGIHLTARGYAFMANKFLEAIDAKFDTNFVASGNLAKANDYPTNYSPTLQ